MRKEYFRVALFSFLMLAGTFSFLFSQEAVGKVVSLEGKAEKQAEDSGEWAALSLEDEIHERDTIKTLENSRMEIFFVDGSSVSIGAETSVKVEKLMCSPAKNYREGKFKVIMGKVRFNVGKLFSKNSTFEVRTPTAVAGVKGTSFIVWVTSEQLTQLLGINGSVTVKNILPSVEGESLLTRGFVIYVPDGVPPGDPIPTTFDELLDFLKNLGPVDRGYDRNPETGGGGNIRLRGLGPFIPPTDQTNIIDQPVKTDVGDLPEPPAPPQDDNNRAGGQNGVQQGGQPGGGQLER